MANTSRSSNRRVRRIRDFAIYPAGQDEAPSIARIAREISPAGETARFRELTSAGAVERMLQTGHQFLVAERDGAIRGFVRGTVDEGIAWFDLLAATAAGAGRALVRAVEMQAQEAGIRLVRCRAPGGILEDYFGWLGYLPVSREDARGETVLVLERRLPLLTVRAQRREDAAFIAGLTSRDPYAFEMGARPGWFVAADGDRAVGVAWVSDGGDGIAEIPPPVLLDGYRHRGLEAWMLERAAFHAQHAGYHTARVSADPWLAGLERDLEDRQWSRDGDAFVRRFTSRAAGESGEMDEDEW